MSFSNRKSTTSTASLKRVEIRLTEHEHWVTVQRAAQYNLSPTEFIRRRTLGTRMPQSVGDTFLKVADHLQRIEAQLNRLNYTVHDARSRNAPILISPIFTREVKSLKTLMRRIRNHSPH